MGKQAYESDIVLGERYRDTQTGVEGVATSISFYQHACERVVLEIVVRDAKGDIQDVKEYYFDSPRLSLIRTGQQATSERPGGPDHRVTAMPSRLRAERR